LYSAGDKGEFFVQPRLLTRTQEVVRAVVEIRTTVEPTSISVEVPPVGSIERAPITEDAFFRELGKNAPKVVDFARRVLEQAPHHNLDIEWGDAGPILKYYEPDSGEFFTLGQLHRNGQLGSTNRLSSRFRKLGLPKEIYQAYLDKLAAFIPGATRRSFTAPGGKQWEQIALSDSPKKGAPRLEPLAAHQEAWFRLIDETTGRIQEAMAQRDERTARI
jgi:hypothetical protein